MTPKAKGVWVQIRDDVRNRIRARTSFRIQRQVWEWQAIGIFGPVVSRVWGRVWEEIEEEIHE